MDEQAVRERAQALCDALVAGDIGMATQDFQQGARQNLGEVLSLLPLPSNQATVDWSNTAAPATTSSSGSVGGPTRFSMIQTRWKDRVMAAQPSSRRATLSKITTAAQVDEEGEAEGETST